MTLHFEPGAVVLGSENYKDYMTHPDWRYDCALFRAEEQHHITVTGKGILDGLDCFCPLGEEGFRGPHMFRLIRCSDLRFEDFTIRNAGNYGILLIFCTDLVVENVTVLAGHDAIHTQRCTNVRITGCTLRTGDDCVAGSDNENVTISHCYFNTACNGLRYGGRNVLVSDCHFQGPPEFKHKLEGRAFSLFCFCFFAPASRRSSIPTENWVIRNITADRILSLYFLDRSRPWQDGPNAKNILFEEVTCTNMQRMVQVLGYGNQETALTLRRCRLHLDPAVPPQPVIEMDGFDSLLLEDVTLDNQGRGPELVLRNGNSLALAGSSASQLFTAENVTNTP